jgi:tRNA G26 N,N-dimethylase Trm1
MLLQSKWHVNVRGGVPISCPSRRRTCPVAQRLTLKRCSAIANDIEPAQLPATQQQDVVVLQERGTPFAVGTSFYRAESAVGRDLAVLAASLYRQATGRLRVIDVMCASGCRGVRYKQQAGATSVWCNDFNPSLHPQVVYNLCGDGGMGGASEVGHAQAADSIAVRVRDVAAAHDAAARVHTPPGLKRPVWEWKLCSDDGSDAGSSVSEQTGADGEGVLRVSHMDAQRLLAACALNEDYYDLIDVDSFGR